MRIKGMDRKFTGQHIDLSERFIIFSDYAKQSYNEITVRDRQGQLSIHQVLDKKPFFFQISPQS
jgi:hypothetical protein